MSVKVIDMARTSFLSSAFLLAALAAPVTAWAWGPVGHRLVAELAEQDLSPQARAEVARLLQGEADPTLAGVANWADQLRENDPELGKESSRWHYVNIADHDCAYGPPRDCPNGDCVIEAIHKQTDILRDTSLPREQRAQALKFVVHFVGDAHQPLHAGRAADKGGNDFQTNYEGKGGNLHRVWDSGLLASANQDEPELLSTIRALPAPTADNAAALPPASADWAKQSCAIVLRSGFYPPSPKLETRYYDTYRPLAEQQIRQAGVRLARLLNAALDPH